MRRLIILRHAKSDRAGQSTPDLARPLNARGQEAAARIGAYMAKHDLVPNLVLCSSAERTKETWNIVATSFPAVAPATFDKRLYDATADKAMELVRETKPDAHTLMVVGHNPTMHELATLLIAAGDIDQRVNLHQKLPTGGLVVIDFPVDSWNDIQIHSGRLDRFISPRSLAPDTA